jgi:opacity protein-like surface antigen
MKNVVGKTCAAGLLALSAAAAAHAADLTTSNDAAPVAVESDYSGGVKIGYLSCDVGSGAGYLIGSAKELACDFRSVRGSHSDAYSGFVKKLGVDLGYTARGKMVWAVFAPTAGYHHGALAGTYVGAAAEATVGVGIGANVLLGGTEGAIQLQPISVEGQLGLNVAAASATVTLHPVN